MIRNMREYDETGHRIADFRQQLQAMVEELTSRDATEAEIALATSGHRQLIAELQWDRDFYDRLRNEGITAVPAYEVAERGKALIALRIACHLSQKDLADRLRVSQAQVSRDENNDYHGITQERYARILESLGVDENFIGFRRAHVGPDAVGA